MFYRKHCLSLCFCSLCSCFCWPQPARCPGPVARGGKKQDRMGGAAENLWPLWKPCVKTAPLPPFLPLSQIKGGGLPRLPLESSLSQDVQGLCGPWSSRGGSLSHCSLSHSRWKLSSRELIRSWWKVRRNYTRCGSTGTRSSSRARRGTQRSQRYLCGEGHRVLGALTSLSTPLLDGLTCLKCFP